VLYYHRDRQGSVVATTVTGGQVGVQYRYGPYGEVDEVLGNEAWAGSDLGYTGGLRLSGTLLHLRARVYDSGLRRFLQADTVDPLRYTYVEGDPANLVDPSGRAANVYPASATAQRVGDTVLVTYYDKDGKKVGEDVFWLTDEQDLQRLKAAQVPSGYIQKNISYADVAYQQVQFRIAPELLSALTGSRLVVVRLPGQGNALIKERTARKVETWIGLAKAKGVRIRFNSAYRTAAKNAAVGGKADSGHRFGEATDVQFDSLRDIPRGLSGREQRDILESTAKAAGLGWGGDWSTPDRHHFYDNPWVPPAQRGPRIEAADTDYARILFSP
jgi:RHS repeat-associated protein